MAKSKAINMKIKFLPFYIVSLLPLPVLYLLSDAACFVIYRISKYRREVVRSNLKNSFIEKSELEIIEIEKKFYRHFCDIMFESLKVLTITEEQISRRFKLLNPELLEHYYNENEHLILYAAHQGNWEWLSFIQLFSPQKIISLYKPLSNRYFDELMKASRERFGAKCVPSEKGYRTILELINGEEASLFALIGDQSPSKESAKVWVNFFNQDTAFFQGTHSIIKKTGQKAIFPAYRKVKRGFYELELKLISGVGNSESEYPLIDNYAKALEDSIRTSPEMWLWSHRRWKLCRPKKTANFSKTASKKQETAYSN